MADKVIYKGKTFLSNGEVAYIVVDGAVFYTGIPLSPITISTLYVPKNVVEAICQKLGRTWSDFRWYDYQTRTMHSYHKAGYVCVNEVILVKSDIGVFKFRDFGADLEMSQVPASVNEAFKDYVK